jgi:aryl-alcohol dehydrogenase-like predicted oxidoreductase
MTNTTLRTEPLPTVELGTTGEQVSKLALGCMNLGTQTGDEESFALLDRYAEDGGSFLDTADCYAWWGERGSAGGHSESVIGRWLTRTGRRDETFIATKGSGAITNQEAAWPDSQTAAD